MSKFLAIDTLATPLARLVGGSKIGVAHTPYGYRPIPLTATGTGFTGQLCEAGLGWYLLGNGHRSYNPVLMRFHSPDHFSPFLRGGTNAYVYCKDDPINGHDRNGRWPINRLTTTETVPSTTPPALEHNHTAAEGFQSLLNVYGGAAAVHLRANASGLLNSRTANSRSLSDSARTTNPEIVPTSITRSQMTIQGVAALANAATVAMASYGAYSHDESWVFTSSFVAVAGISTWLSLQAANVNDQATATLAFYSRSGRARADRTRSVEAILRDGQRALMQTANMIQTVSHSVQSAENIAQQLTTSVSNIRTVQDEETYV